MQNTYPKISIIANFYNSSKYIPHLLKSIFLQTYQNFELICIDDCSPQKDNLTIQNLIKKNYNIEKVKIIRNKQNLGIAKSKEVGIMVAEGEYITFIDGDDYFAPNAIEVLVKAALKYDTDIILANSFRHYNFLGIKKDIPLYPIIEEDDYYRCISQNEILNRFLINFCGVNIFNHAYWGKLYKRDFLRNLGFDYPPKEISAFEDQKFSLKATQEAKNILFIKDFIYYWRWGGLTTLSNIPDWQAVKYLPVFNDYYIERKEMAKSIPNGYLYLLAELKNTFRIAIINIATKNPKHNNISEQIDFIKEILQHPAYNDIKDLLTLNENYKNDQIIINMIEKDYISIFENCYRLYKKGVKHRIYKYLLSKGRVVD